MGTERRTLQPSVPQGAGVPQLRGGSVGQRRCRPRGGAGSRFPPVSERPGHASRCRAEPWVPGSGSPRPAAPRGHGRVRCPDRPRCPQPPAGPRGFGGEKKGKGGGARRKIPLRAGREPFVRPFSGALLFHPGEGAGGRAPWRGAGCGAGCGAAQELRSRAGGGQGGTGGVRAAALLAGPGGRGWGGEGGEGWAWPGRLVPPPEMQQFSPLSLFSPRGGRTAMETRRALPGACAARPVPAAGC